MNSDTFPILLVEDDSNDVLLLQRAFRRANVECPLHVVTNGDDAVDYLTGGGEFADRAAHPFPALMLLDLKLPRRSGLEVLSWLREQPPEISCLPVIVLTSSRLTSDVDQAYAFGATSYMAKPEGNFDGLAEVVKTLDRRR